MTMMHDDKTHDTGRRLWLQATAIGGALAALAPLAGCASASLGASMPPVPSLQMTALAAALAAGRTSARAVAEQSLARAQARSGDAPRTWAAVHAEQSRATALAVDQRRREGVALPPLAGIPVAVQDVLDEAGQSTRAGTRLLQGRLPAPQDAVAVRRLRDAGLVLIGRTRSAELAWPGLGLHAQDGTPRNRYDRAVGRVPGGGASGAAIAVADGVVAAAIGNDSGGGLRVPAALNGLVAWKPTARRVPREGMLPLSPTLDSIGVIANTVDDCTLLDGVLAGTSPQTVSGPLVYGLRLAVPTTLVQDGLSPEVAQAFGRALGRLVAAGAQVVEIAMPAFAQAVQVDPRGLITAAEAQAGYRGVLVADGARLDPRVLAGLQAGASVTEATLARQLAARNAFIAAVGTAAMGFDALLWPSTQDVAPTLAEAEGERHAALRERLLRNAALVNLFDGCALTIPCQAAGDAPVGITVAGVAGSDARVLTVGRTVEGVVTPRPLA